LSYGTEIKNEKASGVRTKPPMGTGPIRGYAACQEYIMVHPEGGFFLRGVGQHFDFRGNKTMMSIPAPASNLLWSGNACIISYSILLFASSCFQGLKILSSFLLFMTFATPLERPFVLAVTLPRHQRPSWFFFFGFFGFFSLIFAYPWTNTKTCHRQNRKRERKRRREGLQGSIMYLILQKGKLANFCLRDWEYSVNGITPQKDLIYFFSFLLLTSEF